MGGQGAPAGLHRQHREGLEDLRVRHPQGLRQHRPQRQALGRRHQAGRLRPRSSPPSGPTPTIPITVDMSGSLNAKSMTVEVYDSQGQKLATQELTPASPKWQTKFDKPGEYSFKGVAVNMAGEPTANPCAGKVSINFPPICKLWTSCMPCEDYVGRPITFDASGSSDPDGKIVKVVFELLDAQGNGHRHLRDDPGPLDLGEGLHQGRDLHDQHDRLRQRRRPVAGLRSLPADLRGDPEEALLDRRRRPRHLRRQHRPLRVPARRPVRLDHPRQVELHSERRRRHPVQGRSLEARLHRRRADQRALPGLLHRHRHRRQLADPAQGRSPQVRRRPPLPAGLPGLRQVDQQGPGVRGVPRARSAATSTPTTRLASASGSCSKPRLRPTAHTGRGEILPGPFFRSGGDTLL
ncbi:MAG: hypothetical protein M0C28_04330 [Candidatus Moduliflexus flocculans]|nr:hypothetical protein [Candidatus Moduliflexus flocculans]